jgi:hypothetical protein
MFGGVSVARIAAVGAWVLVWLASPSAQMRWVDIERSKVTVYVSTSGAPRETPTGHVLEAPLAEGSLEDTDEPHLALVINVAELRLLDPERSQVMLQMLGPEGLDAEQFSRITYHSLTINQIEANVWLVQGELGMHGRFLPLNVTATRQGDRFTGTASVFPTDFGIPPMRFTGNPTITDNQVRVDFEIALEAP